MQCSNHKNIDFLNFSSYSEVSRFGFHGSIWFTENTNAELDLSQLYFDKQCKIIIATVNLQFKYFKEIPNPFPADHSFVWGSMFQSGLNRIQYQSPRFTTRLSHRVVKRTQIIKYDPPMFFWSRQTNLHHLFCPHCTLIILTEAATMTKHSSIENIVPG